MRDVTDVDHVKILFHLRTWMHSSVIH